MEHFKKKILIITFRYPPMQTAGAYRMVSLAKFLPRFGYKVYILTVRINRGTWNGAIDVSDDYNATIFRTNAVHIGEVSKMLFKGRFSGHGKTRSEFHSKKAGKLKNFLSFFYDNILTFPEPEDGHGTRWA